LQIDAVSDGSNDTILNLFLLYTRSVSSGAECFLTITVGTVIGFIPAVVVVGTGRAEIETAPRYDWACVVSSSTEALLVSCPKETDDDPAPPLATRDSPMAPILLEVVTPGLSDSGLALCPLQTEGRWAVRRLIAAVNWRTGASWRLGKRTRCSEAQNAFPLMHIEGMPLVEKSGCPMEAC
jgi:hypothetical protein